MLTISVPRPSGPRPHGRHRECETLDQLVATVCAGGSQILVLRGEQGAGKSVLLDYVAARAAGCRVVRAAGVESERELPFAGLHQLCAPLLSGLEQLPDPQRRALDTVFGLRSGDAPDRFLVGMAVMSLLSTAAADRPLVCILDDAQWLDGPSAQTLGFVARRLVREPVAVVIAARECSDHSDVPDLTGLPELDVSGLADGDARSLLESSVTGPLDERVLERIAVEARGNPRALKEAMTWQEPDHLAGGFGLPRITLPHRMVHSFRQRLVPLPSATQQLLLLAAAEPTGDPVLLWRAADQLGITAGAAAPAVTTRIIELDGYVSFCHPVARSVVYQAASPEERRLAHHALADATDPSTDPDRRAWHHAQSVSDPDDEAANELERTADQAMARGGLPALAAFRARAAELTADPSCRARRALAAAQAKHQAGALGAARRLLAMAEAGPLDELASAQVQLLRAQLAVHGGRGANTSSLLLRAAQRLEPVQPELARAAYGEAFEAALTVGHLDARGGAGEIALAVQAAPTSRPPDGPSLLLAGLAALTSQGHTEGVPVLKQALQIFRNQVANAGEEVRWLPLACRVAQELWDDRSWHALTDRLIQLSRQVGALTVLPGALVSGSVVQLLAVGCDAAVSMAQEAEAVGLATSNPVGPCGRLALAAWKGRETETSRLIAEASSGMAACRERECPTVAHWATAVLSNGLGRYNDALVAAEHGSEHPGELGLATWSLVELIEAAARVGSPGRAALALRGLSVSTDASATDWALGIKARSQALVNEGEDAERFYLEAIEKLSRTLVRADLGRAHLLYGEWLRRQGRRVDARVQLRTAHEILIELGIEGFAERTRRELEATGATVRKRKAHADQQLTAQEAQIARMAREGRTNSEISVQLFISPRTVEWHLHKVFMKLGISSRRQLSEVVPAVGWHALPA